MPCETNKANKINGYDKWEVEGDARTLIKAKELEQGDEKYYGTVCSEVRKVAKAAVEAAEVKDKAAKEVTAVKKAGKKMKKVFGKNSSHNSSSKGGY